MQLRLNSINIISILVLVVALFSCSPKLSTSVNTSYPPLSKQDKVHVYFEEGDEVRQAEKLGQIEIANRGFSEDCEYLNVVEDAKAEARKAGGDGLYVYKLKSPGLFSNCHGLSATILKFGDAIQETNEISLPQEEQVAEEKSEVRPIEIDFSELRKDWRLAFQGGLSYLSLEVPEDTSPDYEDYLLDLSLGYHLGGDLAYFFNEKIGVGLRYSWFHSENDGDFYFEDDQGVIRNIHISDDIKINYIGPTFNMRFPSKKSLNAMYLGASMGYLSYWHDTDYDGKQLFEGATLGLAVDFGYDFVTSENFAVGVQLSMVMGALTEYTVDDGVTKQTIQLNDDELWSLSRIDLSVGVRFMK